MPPSPTKLVSHDELPAWCLDNEFIVNGYRAPGGISDDQRGRVGNGHKDSKKTSNGSTSETGDYYEHDSLMRCWLSIWLYIHNESVNIHTHFWGALIALSTAVLHILSLYDLVPSFLYPITHHPIFYPEAMTPLPQVAIKKAWISLFSSTTPVPASLPVTIGSLISTPVTKITPWLISYPRPNDWKDVAGFCTYLIGAITVLSFSATFHTVVCHSKEVAKACNKLDYIGIVAMIVGSFLPMLHYGFYCHPNLQLLYSSAILILGGFAMYTVLSPKYHTPKYRPIRTSVFLALGLSAIFPVAHVHSMYGYDAVAKTMGLNYLVTGGALYVVGACLYMARFPERLKPGMFDYFFASHQIFHVFILLAAFSHYVCIRRSYTFWHTVEAIKNGDDVCLAFDSLRNR